MKEWFEKLEERYSASSRKILFSDGGRQWSEEEFCQMVIQIHNKLIESGVLRGERILLMIPVSIELYAFLYGVWSVGATAVLFDSDMTFENRVECMKRVKPKMVFAAPKTEILADKLVKTAGLSSTKKIQEFFRNGSKKKMLEGVANYQEEYALITFTSGSTGIPKGIARTYQYLEREQELIQKYFLYREGEIDFAVMPVFTSLNAMCGVKTVIPEVNIKKNSEKIEKIVLQIQEEGVNRLIISPNLLKQLAKCMDKKNTFFENVKKVFVGGGPFYYHLLESAERIFPNAQIKLLYGCCEAEPIAMINTALITQEQKKSMRLGKGLLGGKIVEEMLVKIIKNDPNINASNMTNEEFQEICVEDTPGEIVVSGEYVLGSYLNGEGNAKNKIQTEDTVWHRTGDLGQIREDGILYLYGRCKEQVCYRQEVFYPFSEESRIYENFDVRQAAYLQWSEERVLVVDCEQEVYKAICKQKEKFHSDLVIQIDRIPLDRKHRSKIDYKYLREILSKKESQNKT